MTRPDQGPQGRRDGGVPSTPRSYGAEVLLRSEVRPLVPDQLRLYTPESAQLRPVRPFNPAEAMTALHDAEGRDVLGIDMGGDKIAAKLARVRGGSFVTVAAVPPFRSEKGAGYVEYMEELARMAASEPNLSVGFSFAGPIDGTKPRVYTNVPAMQERVDAVYGGDLAAIFPHAEHTGGGNDAGTGLVAATVEAYRLNPHVKKVVYLINGGGLGGAVFQTENGLSTGHLFDAEPGHIAVVQEYNPFNQGRPCEQAGSPTPDLPCIEKIGSSGQGVEKTFNALYPAKAPFKGEDVAALYKQGDPTALAVYDNAAALTAVAILGLDQASNGGAVAKPLNPAETVVVCHGGIFNVDGFGDRVEQYLQAHIAAQKVGYDAPQMMYTKDFTHGTGNACMDGAAILALTAPSTSR